MREAFEMPGVPIRLVLRASENPFANKAKKRKIG
jgi:GTP-binding protein